MGEEETRKNQKSKDKNHEEKKNHREKKRKKAKSALWLDGIGILIILFSFVRHLPVPTLILSPDLPICHL